MKRLLGILALAVGLIGAPVAFAATEWSTQDYDLYPGDFDGDGKTDLLYVAKDASKASGIARSDGSGPNIPYQSWPSNYLGIPWHGNIYGVIVADFNNDDKDDLFLQRSTAGDSFLLLTDANGKITGISQTVANTAFGLTWSADQHKIIAGDFSGDGKADLFLQAKTAAGTNAVMYADTTTGQFTSGPTQSWTDSSWSAFKWSAANSNIFAGDFNGDGKADLLIQAKPKIVMVDYDVPIPVPTFAPNSFGVVTSQGTATPFIQTYVQQWSRNAHGVDWSTLAATVVVGDFNGDGRADVILQARYAGRPSYLLTGNSGGAAFGTGSALATNVTWASDAHRLVAGNFDGTGGTGVYYQAVSSGGTNSYANTVTGGSVSTTTHNPTTPTGVVAASAVGHTVGSFAVSNAGLATYSIPVSVPPGVSGIQPSLSINYQSGGGNGLLGIGWGLAGLSEIERCGKTLAQDNSTDGVSLTLSDRFCLDGNKLRLTSGTYGVAGSKYQTEIETFVRVTANGSAGNGPQYFTVEGKDGLLYEYGNSTDSRIESLNPSASTTIHTWALNRVSDRHGNSMTISYQKDGSPNGSFRPDTLLYTSNSGASLSAAYRVVFFWDLRQSSDTLRMYVAGGQVTERYRLNRIETQYNDPAVGTWRLVRKYQMSYNTSGATPYSRLGAIQECDRNGSCLSPTMIAWQDGTSGWSGSDVTSTSNAAAMMEYSYAIDVNGDGRDDLVYPETVSGTTYWHFMTANGSGGFNTPVNTSINAGDSTYIQYTRALPIDYFSEGRVGLLVEVPGYSTRQILRWNGSTLALTSTNISVALDGKEWVADFDGDGRQDFLYSTSTITTGYFHVQWNAGSITAPAQFAAAQQFYSTPNPGNVSPFGGPYSSAFSRLMDFNGDGRGDFIYSALGASCGGGDICTYTTVFTALISTGSTFSSVGTWSCDQIGAACSMFPIVADFNGDGHSDVLTLSGDITGSHWSIAYGTGTGLTTPAPITLPDGIAEFTADYNGDGRADLFYNSGNQWSVLTSNGTGFDVGATISLTPTTTGNTLRLLDLDGDGQQDMGYKSSQFRVRRHNGTSRDFVSSITDGFGNSVAIQYAPLTDASVYTPGSGASYPQVDVHGPIYVVKKYDATDGVGGTYSVTHKYAGLRVDLRGRGPLGFASRESVDSRNGIKSVVAFRQDYPYIGMVSQASTYQSSAGGLMAQVTNTPDVVVTDATPYNDRRMPFIYQSIEDNYEVGGPGNGQPIARVTQTTTLNSYGNPTNVTTATADQTGSGLSYTTSTTNTYASVDTTNWCLAFVQRQQTQSTVPTYGTATRTIEYVKDTTNLPACRLRQAIVEPDDTSGTLKVTTTIGYDAFGHPNSQLVEAANVEPRTTTTSFGTQGVFPMSVTESVTSSFNHTASKTYDFALGVPQTATDVNGLVSSFDYDGFARLKEEIRPDGTKTSFTYSACTIGNGYCGDSRLRYQVEKRELDSSSTVMRTSRHLFDAFSRTLYSQTQTLSGAFTNVATNYDNLGRPYQQSRPYFSGFAAYFTTLNYDLLGRPTHEQRRISDANAATQTTQFTYNRLISSIEDANGKTTTKEVSAIGHVVKMTDAAGGITRYEYDPFGNLTKTVDPASNEIVNAFNIRGFKTSSADPDMGAWVYTYYPTGELWTQVDAKNQTVTLTYDRISRPKTRNEPEGLTTFTYGETATSANKNRGRLTSVSAPNAYSESFVYDGLGRLQDATTSADATAFLVSSSYNSTTGLLETVTYPTSTSAVSGSRLKVKYEYEYGLLKRTRDFHTPSTVYWEQIATSAAGEAIDEQLGNGLHTYSTYDSLTGLLGARTAGATSQIQNLTYQWDKVGNLTERKDLNLNLTENFYYDNLYRLDYSQLNGVTNVDLAYNAIGNITSKTGIGTYIYPASGTSSVRPHAVTSAGSDTYGYDNNGNMTSRKGSAITWYSYNLPNRIDQGSNYSQFYYGADRARYKQVAYTAAGGSLPAGTETTIYVGGLYERVTKPSGVIEHKHYILAGNEPIAIRTLRSNSADDTRYLHKDHLGSVDTITNESGAVVQRLSYDAFGKRRSATAWSGALSGGDWTNIAALTHRGFTFHEQLDNVELVHMNGRVYDPDIGRFVSADPFIQAPLMSQSLNRYSYVMNNPLSLVDPSGYSWLSKAWRSVKKWASRQWDSIRHNLNYIAAAVLVVIGVVADIYSGGLAGQPFYTAALSLIKSPVQVGYSRDGPYVIAGYGGFGVQTQPFGSGGSRGTAPPMTAPAGAVSFALPVVPQWAVNEFAGIGDALTFGVTRMAREAWDIGSVDASSSSYEVGYWGATAAGVLASGGASLYARAAVGGVRIAIPSTARAATTVGREIKLIDGFYQADGSAFKFSKYYYEKLWATGRGAPFVQAEEVLATARTVTPDRMAGFYRYTNDFMEMVYNPTTKEVWHLMPLPRR